MRLRSCLALLPALLSFAAADPAAAPATPDRRLYVVGYAHLDTQWRWTYPQVIREFIANTLHDNFELFPKYPNYIFNFSGSRRYEMMAEYYPEDFVTLKQYVADGRWFPCGSSVDEGDSIVPSAESLVRHVLYGNRYFRKEFGVASHEFMLPDCFGFPAALPSILAHCGIEGFSTQKLTWGSANGIPFKVGTWVGPDGRSVVAALDPGAYTGKVTEDLSQNPGWLARVDHTGALSGAYVDYHYFGTGDRGGAPIEDSVRWIERSVAGTGPLRVISSTAERMFRELTPEQKSRLPRYQGELLLVNHSAGSISSEGYMKHWNRKNELIADATERAALTARVLAGTPYPSDRLYRAWDLVLGSQMHDMLPGTSLPLAYQFCWNDESIAQNQFAAVLQDSLGASTQALDTGGEGRPLVVYNPLAAEREDVAEARLADAGSVTVAGPDGMPVPSQVVTTPEGGRSVLFLAKVASVGMAVYSVRPGTGDASPGELRVTTRELENRRYRVTIDAGGNIASIYDKEAGRELLAAPIRLAFQFERPVVYPAWNMDWEDQRQPPRGYVSGPAAIRIAEKGPVRVAIEVSRWSENSRFVDTVRLAAGGAGDRVEISSRIDWQGRSCALKAVFPFSVANPLATYDAQLGTVQRGNDEPTRFEVPQHQWFDLTATDGRYGVAVLNDSKFGSDKPDEHTLRLTLIYTPGVRDRTQDQASQDEGRHRILYAVMGHAGDWRQGGVVAAAARLNQPLIVVEVGAHPGVRGKRFSLLHLSTAQVGVQALKQAEEGDEIIVRLKEREGRAATGVRVAFAEPVVAAREVNGQEQPLGPARVENGALVADVPGYGLRAFAVRLAKSSHADARPMAATQRMLPLTATGVAATWPKRGDSRGFDGAGRTYPADRLNDSVEAGGIHFTLARGTNGAGAMRATGQEVPLDAANQPGRLWILAASDSGDQPATVTLLDGARQTVSAVHLRVGDWSGFVGQWDTRIWEGEQPEIASTWTNPLVGLRPGYVKPSEIAWFCSHTHDAAGENEPYRYCYLFKYAVDVPAGAAFVRLSDNPHVRLFALTLESAAAPRARLAHPLDDHFADHGLDAPRFSPAPGHFTDTTLVTIVHPLYWREGQVRYTVDGSEPTAASAAYVRPLVLSRAAVVRARFIGEDGSGPAASGAFAVDDTTPPRVIAAYGVPNGQEVRVVFSEPVDPGSGTAAGNYTVGGAHPQSVRLLDEGCTAELRLAAPAGADRLTVDAVADRSPRANRLSHEERTLEQPEPLLRAAAGAPAIAAGNLSAGWSLNLFVRANGPVPNRTALVTLGAGTLAKYADGVRFSIGKVEARAGDEALPPHRWVMFTVTCDGRNLILYRDGRQVGEGAGDLNVGDDPTVQAGGLDPWERRRRFGGDLRSVTVFKGALAPDTVALLWEARRDAP